MGQFAIAITKRAIFRDATQEWTNTYHYANVGPNPAASAADTLIDYVADKEKTWHSTGVTFIRGRCWSSGGTQAENQMITEKVLTGNGATPATSGFDKERAILMQWPAGLDNKGRPVYLRKWYHVCGQAFGFAFSAGAMANETKLPDDLRAAAATAVDALSRIPAIEAYGLVAESGRTRTGGLMSADPPICHKYLEHHQLGDQWR